MRIDPDICTDPALLAAEVRRLQAAVQSLPGEVRDTAPISGAGKSAEKANAPPEPSPASAGYAVGDVMAFQCGLRGESWELHKITRITEKRLMTCGPYQIDAHLRVRGRTGYSGPICRGRPTPKIMAEVRRQRAIAIIKATNWSGVPLDNLLGVIAVLEQDA
jgi:hypothetical protein